jgi:hypothetical protein
MNCPPELTRPMPLPIFGRSMRATLFVLAIALGCTSGAWAQAPAAAALGSVTHVEGLVTMSLGSQVATVQPGTPVFDGARFVSSSSGSLEFSLPGGCNVGLQPNQLVQVSSSLTCSQQIASVVSLPAGAAGNSLFALRSALPLAGSAAAAAAVARVPEPEITPRPQ